MMASDSYESHVLYGSYKNGVIGVGSMIAEIRMHHLFYTTWHDGGLLTVFTPMYYTFGDEEYDGRITGLVNKPNGELPRIVRLPSPLESYDQVESTLMEHVVQLREGEVTSPYFTRELNKLKDVVDTYLSDI